MSHFLSEGTEAPSVGEGHCSGWPWVAGNGMGGAAPPLPQTRAQTAAPAPALISHNGNSPSQPRRAAETQIGSRALGSLFLTGSSQEQASEAGLGLGGGAGCSSWGSGLWAACNMGLTEGRGVMGGNLGAKGVSRRWEDGNLSLSLLDHLLLVPSRVSFWPHNDLSIENLDHGLPCSGTTHPFRSPQPFIQAP